MAFANQYYWMRNRQRPCTCLADVSELEGRRVSMFDAAMPADYFVRKLPRKWWEWDYIAGCAELLGILRPNTTALGLGVGFEPLMFHFANSCGKVIATDLYSSETAWSEARFQTLNDVIASSPIEFPQERLRIQNADMRHTDVDAGSVDLIWSCSSIEHVPTLKDLFAVFEEIDRTLKIGGHAILTTEYCITGNSYLLPGVNAWNRQIFDAIRTALVGFEFLGMIDLSFNSLHPGNAARPRRYLPVSSMPASSPHFSYYHRAGTVANPVGLSIIVPIAFVLRKTSEAGVAPWSRIDIPSRLRSYSDGLSAFFDGRNQEAISLLEKVYRSADDDPQLKHHAFRFLSDAKARTGHMAHREEFVASILEFLLHLPEGPVQDADVLDLCAYLLCECGRLDESLHIYEKCIQSPSTNREHLFELMGRYLATAEVAGKSTGASDMVASLIIDLVQFGLSSKELRTLCSNLTSGQGGKSLMELIARDVENKFQSPLNRKAS